MYSTIKISRYRQQRPALKADVNCSSLLRSNPSSGSARDCRKKVIVAPIKQPISKAFRNGFFAVLIKIDSMKLDTHSP